MGCRQDYKFLVFSLSPGSYIHHSWLKDMDIEGIFSWEFGEANRNKLLSEFLIEQGNLQTIDLASFSQEEKKLFILSSTKVKLLVCYLGIFFCQELVKNQVLKEQVIKIKSSFGEKAYLFGLKKAPYLLKDTKITFPDNRNNQNVRGEVIAHGMACLLAYLSLFPDDIKKRVLWKLPNQWQANDYAVSSDNASQLINKVLQEVKW